MARMESRRDGVGNREERLDAAIDDDDERVDARWRTRAAARLEMAEVVAEKHVR